MDKKYKVDLNEAISSKLDQLKSGDFSVLTDDETDALLRYIRNLVNKTSFSSYDKNELTYDIFHEIVKSKLKNLDPKVGTPMTYIGNYIKWFISREYYNRNLQKSSIHYNGKLAFFDGISSKTSHRNPDNRCEVDAWEVIADKNIDKNREFWENNEPLRVKIIEDAFAKSEILRKRLIEKKTMLEIAKEMNITSASCAKYYFDKDYVDLQCRLAEEGFYGKLACDKSEVDHLTKVREDITKYGVAGAYVLEKVTAQDIGKAVGIDNINMVMFVINKHRNNIQDKIDQLQIRPNIQSRSKFKDAFIIVQKGSKNLDNITDQDYLDTFACIDKNKFASQFCNNNQCVRYLKKTNPSKYNEKLSLEMEEVSKEYTKLKSKRSTTPRVSYEAETTK